MARTEKKGDLIGIKGNIKNHNWQDKQGNTHYDYSFIAERVSFLSNKSKEIKQEIKDNTSAFEEFGKQIEMVDINDNFLDD